MRGQALLAVSALTAALMAAQPAAAQNYNSYHDAYVGQAEQCQVERQNNTAGGAILGGLLGAVLGSHVAANHHRSDGALVGAGAGALMGGAIGNNTQTRTCYPPDQRAYDPYYGQPQPQGYSQQYDPRDDQRYAQRDPRDDGQLYGGRRSSYDDRSYRRDDCRWDQMVVRGRDGYPHRENVWMCRGRDGEWRPANY